jgi:hypothetical protein
MNNDRNCEHCEKGFYLWQKTEDLTYAVALPDGTLSKKKIYYQCDRCGVKKEIFEPELKDEQETEQKNESGESRTSSDQSYSRGLEEKRVANSRRFGSSGKKIL